MPEEINVTSINQQGGITAYQVNIQSGDRVLEGPMLTEFKSVLAKYAPSSITIESPFGDQEALRLKQQMEAFLIEQGYNLQPGYQYGTTQVQEPLTIIHSDSKGAPMRIRIGGKR